MKKKIYRIVFMLMIVISVISSNQVVNATLGDGVNTGTLGTIVGNSGNAKINSMFNTISTTIVRVIQAFCIAGVAVNGFKYMMAGAEGKSKIKENLIWMLFGLLLVTGANAIINLIVRAGNQAL